jgi:hypothetical protein
VSTELEAPTGEPTPFWEKLQRTPRPVRLIDFPRQIFNMKRERMAIRVLTQEERELATAAAAHYVAKRLRDELKGDQGYEELYAQRLATEMLWHACRDGTPDLEFEQAFFPTSDILAQVVNVTEIATLIEEYRTTERELSPIVATHDEDEDTKGKPTNDAP